MIQFRQLLSRIFGIFSNETLVLGPVAPDETVTAYIFSRSHFSKERVKYGAFMPSKKTVNKSVFRISDLSEKSIWEIGHKYVANERGDALRARGDLGVEVVRGEKLDVEPDTTPHQRHAIIIGWDSDRSKWKLIAMELAKSADLYIT